MVAAPTEANTRKNQLSLTSSGNKSFRLPNWCTGNSTASCPNCWNITKVCSLREYHSENRRGKPYTYISSVAEPICTAARAKQHIKLYRPFSTPRFLYGGSFSENYCFGLEQLPAKGDTLFITGGEKDVLSLAAHGFHAICFNSETVTIPPTLVYRLTFRFKHIVLLFDMDKTGRESSRKQEKLLKNLA